MTVAIIGAILLFLTNGLASYCTAEPDPARGHVSAPAYRPWPLTSARSRPSSSSPAVRWLWIAFIWYMFWGYKANGQVSGSGDARR